MGEAEVVENTEHEVSPYSTTTSSLAWDPSVGATPLGFGWDAEPLVLDWDGLGRNDLLVTAGGGPSGRRARLFRPLGHAEGHSWCFDAGEPIDSLDGLRCVCAIPNGKSTRFDLIALAPQGLVLLQNEGAPDRPRFGHSRHLGSEVAASIKDCRVVQIFPVDWDGDGLTDLLVGVDELDGYWPDSPCLPPEQQKGFNQKAGHPSYLPSGLWRGKTPCGRVFWLKNVGQLGAPLFEPQADLAGERHVLDVGLHPAPLCVAWGRPRSLELMLTDRRGLIHVHRNFGDQRPPIIMEPKTLTRDGAQFVLPEERTTIFAFDLDGDRRDELLYGTADGRLFAIHTASSRQFLKNPEPLLQRGAGLWLGGRAVVTAGDLGSGGLDLVVGDATGRLHLLRDTGSAGKHRYRLPVTIESGGAPFQLDPGPDGMLDGPAYPRLGYSCPLLVDWYAHGRLDILAGGAGGEVLALRNDGAAGEPRFGSPVPLRCEGHPLITPPRVRPAVVDWYGKGLPDLIALDLQGLLCLFPRVGPAEVGRPVPFTDRLGRFLRLDGGFGLSGGCSLWAGPWCGNGKPDILVGLPLYNRHVIPALTGKKTRPGEELATVLVLENLSDHAFCPRTMSRADGRPLIAGDEGCTPNGVEDIRGRGLDLLIGSDDGGVELITRDELRWS